VVLAGGGVVGVAPGAPTLTYATSPISGPGVGQLASFGLPVMAKDPGAKLDAA